MSHSFGTRAVALRAQSSFSGLDILFNQREGVFMNVCLNNIQSVQCSLEQFVPPWFCVHVQPKFSRPVSAEKVHKKSANVEHNLAPGTRPVAGLVHQSWHLRMGRWCLRWLCYVAWTKSCWAWQVLVNLQRGSTMKLEPPVGSLRCLAQKSWLMANHTFPQRFWTGHDLIPKEAVGTSQVMYVWFDALINYMSGVAHFSDWNLPTCFHLLLDLMSPTSCPCCRMVQMLRSLLADSGQPTCTSWARKI